MKPKTKTPKVKKTREEKRAEAAAAHRLFGEELREGLRAGYERRYEFLAWVGCWSGLALISLFFTGWTINADGSFPWVVLNVVCRAFSLIFLTFAGTVTPFRKTLFTIGSTAWCIWMLLLSPVSYGVAVIVFVTGLLLTVWFAFQEIRLFKRGSIRPVSRKLRSWVKFFYAIAGLAFLVEFIHALNFRVAYFNISAPFVMILSNPDRFMSNMLIIFATGTVIMICKRKKFATVLFVFVWLLLSIISLLKIHNVYEPLMLLDIFAFMDMAAVVTKFLKWFFFLLLGVAVAGLVVLLVYLAKKEKKAHVRGDRVIFAAIMGAVAFLGFVGASLQPYAQFEEAFAIDNYYKQGFASSFTRTLVRSIPTKPENYTEHAFEEVAAMVDAEYEPREPLGVKNVIVIQMESYCDPYDISERNPEISFEYDPVPFLRSLEKEYSTGKVNVPVYGGQTVKSEFEFLTGVDLKSLPHGYNPFVTILNTNKADSLARYFNSIGFATTAIHNYQGEFFSRHQVYNNIGFDTFVPMETMDNVRRRGNDIWAADDVLPDVIRKALDENEGPNFVFTATVQLHGNYPAIPREKYPMTITGLEDEHDKEGRLQYYVSQLIEFDEAMRGIVEMLEKRGEPTVLLLYADHLPQLTNELCRITNEDTFATSYYTWNNIGLEKKDGHTELYLLSTELLESVGLDGGFINKFHTVMRTKDESVYQTAADIVGYEMVFKPGGLYEDGVEYKIGLSRPELISVELDEEASGTFSNAYRLKATGLTDNTVITVNGRMFNIGRDGEFDAHFETGLNKIEPGDVITLRIVGERLGTVFSESRQLVFGE